MDGDDGRDDQAVRFAAPATDCHMLLGCDESGALLDRLT